MTRSEPRAIVVAVPADDDLESVLHYAAAEARVHRCGLLLVHAHPPGDESHAELVLARARSVARLLAGPAVPISTRRATGEPVESVLAVGRDARAVVLRKRDSLHLMRVLSAGAAGAGARPTVVCVPGDWGPWRCDPRPVLVAVEDPSDSAYALERGLEIAHEHHASLSVLHVWHLSERDEALVGERIAPALAHSLQASLRAELERVRHDHDFHDVPVDLDVRHGAAAELVLEAARDAQALVLVRNAPAADGSVHLGRTARAALHESVCPTVILASPPPPSTRRVLPSATGPGATGSPGPPASGRGHGSSGQFSARNAS